MTHRNYTEAFFLKLRLGLKAEVSKHYLNYAWWFIEPTLHVTVFYFVFGVLLRSGGEGFVVFLLCGQVPFLWFSRSVSNSTNSIISGQGLIQQMAIPKPFFPLLVVAQDFVKQLIVFACLLLMIAWTGYPIGKSWLALPAIIGVQLTMTAALALLVAAITPFIPDFRFIVGTGMMMLMFSSGIFYDYRVVLLEEHKQLFLLNPVARLIECYRDVLIRGAFPDFVGLVWVLAASGMLLFIMVRFYKVTDATYARLVSQ